MGMVQYISDLLAGHIAMCLSSWGAMWKKQVKYQTFPFLW